MESLIKLYACVTIAVFRQAEKYLFLSYLMQFCSLFEVKKIQKLMFTNQITFKLKRGMHLSFLIVWDAMHM